MGEVGGLERRAHEAHRLVLFVGAAIRVFEPSADETRAGEVGGDARALEISAVEPRALHLGRKQARLDETGPGKISAKRPRLVQRRPIELGVRQVRVVEPRRAQVGAREVEAGKIEPGKALAAEIGAAPGGRPLERGFDLSARHLGRGHVRRGQVETARDVLRARLPNGRDRERNREHAFHQSHGRALPAAESDRLIRCGDVGSPARSAASGRLSEPHVIVAARSHASIRSSRRFGPGSRIAIAQRAPPDARSTTGLYRAAPASCIA